MQVHFYNNHFSIDGFNMRLFSTSVCEGPPHKKGIYIRSTDEGSVARAAGIKPGDRILHCNGRDVTAMDFDEVPVF